MLADGVVPGRIAVDDGWIAAVVEDPDDAEAAAGPLVAPGFIDVHVHGWGGHDATGDADALSGMARALLAPGRDLVPAHGPDAARGRDPAFRRTGCAGLDARGTRRTAPSRWGSTWRARSSRRRARAPTIRRSCARPRTSTPAILEAALDGLRIITIAPELPGSLALIERLAAAGIAASLGHSAATLEEARAGYRGGRPDHDPPVQRHDRRRPPAARAWRSRRSRTTRRTSS